MASKAIGLGVLLILLGIGGYLFSGGVSVTALIPAFFGLPIALLGGLAHRGIGRTGALYAALFIAGIGLAGAVRGVFKLPALIDGTAERPIAIVAQVIMSVACALFVIFGIPQMIRGKKA